MRIQIENEKKEKWAFYDDPVDCDVALVEYVDVPRRLTHCCVITTTVIQDRPVKYQFYVNRTRWFFYGTGTEFAYADILASVMARLCP